MSQIRSYGLVSLVALALVSGCSEDKLQGLCVEDTDCPANFVCDSGRCICKSDASCQPNELCNAAGFCQARVGCESSLDCPEGQFCDRTTGNCLDRERCTADVQCALGQVCDTVRFQCVDGCRELGDCPLGAVCACPDGKPKCESANATCPEGSSTCALGACKTGPCYDNSFCKYGERCDTETRRCVNARDEEHPYCDPCTIAPGQDYCPGSGANFCLIDTSKGYGSFFCGVECSTNDQCPWGFDCNDVLILTQDTCGQSGQAKCRPRPSMACETDADCPGGECDKDTKSCRPICVGNEGDVQGFCTCLADSDCPTDECDSLGRCKISRAQCDANHPCRNIFCKNQTDPLTKKSVGYCFIGRNCAPVEGVSCDQVRGGN